jgi:hypothetical protein
MKQYKASLQERLELYINQLDNEIAANTDSIKRNSYQDKVREYFVAKLKKIKNEFEITKKIIAEL